MSKEEFKAFVKDKPNLAQYVNSGQMTWQKFYEMYSLYGKDSDVWDNYKSDRVSKETISNLIKKVDVDSIKEHISTAQKALDFVQELTTKTTPDAKAVVPLRPLNKFFED